MMTTETLLGQDSAWYSTYTIYYSVYAILSTGRKTQRGLGIDAAEAAGDLIVVENFFEELRAKVGSPCPQFYPHVGC